MTRKKLEQIYYLKKELDVWKRRRADLHMTVKSSSRKLDGMPYSKTNAINRPVEDAAVRISTDLMRIDKQIAKHIKKIAKVTAEAEAYILTVEDPEMRLILELRCIQNMTWEDIGKITNQDYSWCRRKYIKYWLKKSQKNQKQI